MLNFVFHNPTSIYFGRGQVRALGDELLKRARKVLIVTGSGSVKKYGIFDDVLREVKRSGASYAELSGICPNPRLSSVYKGIELAREKKVDLILAVGGGSVVDAAKAVAAGVPYEGDVWDFFEKGIAPEEALPVGTVLTLAATGSEMNANAVITNEAAKRKLALSSPVIQPVFSILDPVYTFTVNSYHTAAGVADIMAHVFEYYLSPVPNADMQDAVGEAILKVCVDHGPLACKKGDDYDARANILWASTLALNGTVGRGKAADWTCHMIEHEVSALNDMSHGAGLAMILPAFMKVASAKYGPGQVARYGRNVFGIKGDSDADVAGKAAEKTREFFDSMALPSRLAQAGVAPEAFPGIARRAIEARGRIMEFEQLAEQDVLRVLELAG